MPRRLEPATLFLIALCFLGTVGTRWFGLSYDRIGALRRSLLWDGEYWRLVTGTFVHGGWLHFLLNGLSLYFVGRVVAFGAGRRVYLATVGLGALAGFATSLLTTTDDVWRMGISGGIAALLGLILAMEWAHSRTLSQFLLARNTLLIFFFILLSVGIGVWVEARNPGVKVDHAAHTGGFLFGLLAGLAYLTRRGLRPVRGLVVALLLGLLPAAYAAHPLFDTDFLMRRGHRLARAGDVDGAAALFERVLDLEAGHAEAAVALALLRDDPAWLHGVEADRRERPLVAHAYLTLAERRFEHAPQDALGLARQAAAIHPAPVRRWLEFARAAHAADAREALLIAYAVLAPLARASQLGPLAAGLLPAVARELEEATGPSRIPAAIRAAQAAFQAAAGLAEDRPEEELERLELAAASLLDRAAAAAREAAAPADATVRELRRALQAGYERLARNAVADERSAAYRYRSAYWWWLEVEGTPDAEASRAAIVARARAALEEAREFGDAETETLAAQWLRERGLDPHKGDLADERDGG